MTSILFIGVLGFLLFIALIYIIVERFTAWLIKHGGVTIRIEEVEEVEDADE